MNFKVAIDGSLGEVKIFRKWDIESMTLKYVPWLNMDLVTGTAGGINRSSQSYEVQWRSIKKKVKKILCNLMQWHDSLVSGQNTN